MAQVSRYLLSYHPVSCLPLPLLRVPLSPTLTTIFDELSEYISTEKQVVRDLSGEEFVTKRIGQGEFSDLGGVYHPARRLLSQYRNMEGGGVVITAVEGGTSGGRPG